MNLSRKILAALTSLALMVMMVGPIGSVQADEPTIEGLQTEVASLQATIDQLTALIASLQTGAAIPVSGGAITGVPTDFTFETDLELGTSGDDVHYLQIVLNSDPVTQLATTGVGSPGEETSYFGPLTKAAVINFQEKYTDDVLAFWGLTSGTGYVGSTTRVKLNELLGVGPSAPVALSVLSVTPESDALDAAVDTEISAVFSDALDADTVTSDSVYLMGEDDQAVDGSVTYNSLAKEVTFAPTADLAFGAEYVVVLTTDITSADGTALVEDASWVFTTAEAAFTGLEVSLSDDTPDSRGIAYNEMGVVYTVLEVEASNEDVVITGLGVERAGLGRHQDFSKIYAVVDGVRHGAKRVLGSDNISELSFASSYSQITIPEGDSQEIQIVADMDAIAGGIAYAGDINALIVNTIETDSEISGDLPIAGNALTITSLGAPTADFTYQGDDDDITVGEEEAIVAEFELENSSATETFSFTSLTLEQAGTVDNEEVVNYTLYDADENEAIAPAVDATADDQIVFELDEPIELEDGDSLDLTVKADVVDGEYQVSLLILDEMTDLVATGHDNGFTVLVNIGNDPLDTADYVHVLVGGTLTVDENEDNPSMQTVAPDTDDVVFLKADFEVEGTVLITSLQLDIIGPGATDELDNVTLYRGDSKVGGPLDYDADALADGYLFFDEDFEVADDQVITVKMDVTDDADNADQYHVVIDSANITAERLDGSDVDTADINGTATGKTVTVGTGALTLAKTSAYGNQEAVAGSKDFKIGSFVLQAGEAEDLDVQNYLIDFNFTGMDEDDISDLTIGDDVIGSPDETNNLFHVNETLAASDTLTVNVYADIDSGLDPGDSFYVNLQITGEGVSSEADVDENQDGQTITIAESSLAVSMSSATPDSAIILASNEDVELGRYNFEATNEEFVIDELRFTLTTPAYDRDFLELYLGYGDSEVTGTAELIDDGVDSIVTFNGLDITVPADDDIDISLYGDLNQIGSGYAISGDLPDFQLTYYKAESDTQEAEEAAPAGAVTPAVKATGTSTIPSAVGTVDLALNLDAVKEITQVIIPTDISGLDGKYFTLSGLSPDDYYVWFDGGGDDPVPAGLTAIAPDISTDLSAGAVATTVAAAINGKADFVSSAVADAHLVKITQATAGAVADAADVDSGVTIETVIRGMDDPAAFAIPYGATKAEIATAIVASLGSSVDASVSGDDVVTSAYYDGLAGNGTPVAWGDADYYDSHTFPALTLATGVDAEFELDTITPSVNAANADSDYNLRITMDDGSGTAVFTVDEATYTSVSDIVDRFVVLINGSSLIDVRAWKDTNLIVEADVSETTGAMTLSSWVDGTDTDGETFVTVETNAAVDGATATATDVATDASDTGLIDLTLNVDGAAVALAYGDTTTIIATKIAAVITSADAIGNGADVELTALAAGTAGNGTLTMADAGYYNTQTVPALTLANGAEEIAGGDIISETMTLREAKPIIEFVDVADASTKELADGQTRKLYSFTVASSGGETEFELSTVKLYVSGSAMTIDNAKIYDAADTSTALDESNETAIGTVDPNAAHVLTFDGLAEKITSEKTYYVKAGFAGVGADEKVTTSYYDTDDTGFAWLDDEDVSVDAALLTIPTDGVTLDESL